MIKNLQVQQKPFGFRTFHTGILILKINSTSQKSSLFYSRKHFNYTYHCDIINSRINKNLHRRENEYILYK